MPFGIPNDPTAGVNPAGNALQAQVDSLDVAIMVSGDFNTGVLSGCAVTASSGLTVAIAAGFVMVQGASVRVTATTKTSGTADATNPRFDLITVDNTGTVALVAGAAAAGPDFPAVTVDATGNLTRVVLAALLITAGLTTTATGNIIDKRVFISPKLYAARTYGRGMFR